MSDRALLGNNRGDQHAAAHVVGGGPIPAGLARDLVTRGRPGLGAPAIRLTCSTGRWWRWTAGGRRVHHRGQRPGTVRSLRLHESPTRLDEGRIVPVPDPGMK